VITWEFFHKRAANHYSAPLVSRILALSSSSLSPLRSLASSRAPYLHHLYTINTLCVCVCVCVCVRARACVLQSDLDSYRTTPAAETATVRHKRLDTTTAVIPIYEYTLYTQFHSIRDWFLKFSDCSCDWQMGKKRSGLQVRTMMMVTHKKSSRPAR
jgi:hypothetical protein